MEDKIKLSETIAELISRIEKKDFTVFFYMVDAEGYPLASQWEFFEHAKVLAENGYKACIVVDDTKNNEEKATLQSELNRLMKLKDTPREELDNIKRRIKALSDVYPQWMGDRFRHLDVKPMSGLQNSTKVSAVDIFVIPDGMKNVAYQLKSLNTKNVLFIQDITAFMRVSQMDMSYVADFGLSDFFVTSDYARDLIGDMLVRDSSFIDFTVIPPTVPAFFNKKEKLKKPKIAIFSKSDVDIATFHKSFTERHPELKWVTLENLSNLPREEFAEKLSECAVSVFMDRRSSYGTFPLESIACGTFPAMLESDYDADYIEALRGNKNQILMANRIVDKKREYNDGSEGYVDLVEAVVRLLLLFLDGKSEDEYFESIKAAVPMAFESKGKVSLILGSYQKLVQKRKEELEKRQEAILAEENKEEDAETV